MKNNIYNYNDKTIKERKKRSTFVKSFKYKQQIKHNMSEKTLITTSTSLEGYRITEVLAYGTAVVVEKI